MTRCLLAALFMMNLAAEAGAAAAKGQTNFKLGGPPASFQGLSPGWSAADRNGFFLSLAGHLTQLGVSHNIPTLRSPPAETVTPEAVSNWAGSELLWAQTDPERAAAEVMVEFISKPSLRREIWAGLRRANSNGMMGDLKEGVLGRMNSLEAVLEGQGRQDRLRTLEGLAPFRREFFHGRPRANVLASLSATLNGIYDGRALAEESFIVADPNGGDARSGSLLRRPAEDSREGPPPLVETSAIFTPRFGLAEELSRNRHARTFAEHAGGLLLGSLEIFSPRMLIDAFLGNRELHDDAVNSGGLLERVTSQAAWLRALPGTIHAEQTGGLFEDLKLLAYTAMGQVSSMSDGDAAGGVAAMYNGMSNGRDPYTRAEELPAERDLPKVIPGINAKFEWDDAGRTVVLGVLDDAIARQAGLRAGDRLLSVNAIPADNQEKMEHVVESRFGRYLLLEVRRGERVLELSMESEQEAAPGYWMDEIMPGIMYAGFIAFNADAEDLLERLLMIHRTQPIRRLILDLRNNSGGRTPVVQRWMRALARAGDIMYWVRDAAGYFHAYRALEDGPLAGARVVGLINGASVSSSEVLGGFIHFLDEGELMGGDSFGKSWGQAAGRIGRFAIKFRNMDWAPPGGWVYEGSGGSYEVGRYYLRPDTMIQESDEDLARRERHRRRLVWNEPAGLDLLADPVIAAAAARVGTGPEE